MPSALETLVKILKLERDQGYANKAMIGGLSAFTANWKPQAQAQARRPEHFMLVDELSDLMARYDTLTTKEARDQIVRYMMDRITGRAAAPQEYSERDYSALVQAAAERVAERVAERAPDQSSAGEPRERSERADRPQRLSRSERPPRLPAAEAQSDDETAASEAASSDQVPNEERDISEHTATDSGESERGGRLKRRDPAQRDTNRRETAPRSERRSASGDDAESRDPSLDRITRGMGRPAVGRSRENARSEGGRPDNSRAENGRGEGWRGESLASVLDKRDEHSAFNMEKELLGARQGAPTTPDVQPLPRLVRPPRTNRPPVDPEQAADIMRGLKAPVERMKNVGPKMALLLNKLGIFTIEDMLFFQPRRYDDYTHMLPIHRLQPNETVTIIGTTTKAEVRIGKNNRKDFFIELDDGTARMNITFFGQHWLSRQLRAGQQIVVRGTTSIYGNRIQMTNPEWEFVDVDNLKSANIVPVYPLTAELSGRALRRLIRQVVDYWAERMPDPLPEPVRERTDLADIGWALQNLHNPAGWDHLTHAKRRLIFDQLLIMQLVMLENRRTWQSVPSQPITVGDEELETFFSTVFPYPLTGAQRRVINEIRGDLAKNVPMNRLLQGDVGSGKTAVAISAMAVALLNKSQAALMAPTGILAEQHYRNVSSALAKMEPMLGYKPVIALLTGSITSSEREAIYRGLADGSIDVAVGTHALIQSGVEYKDLTVAVIDEQHRFGVEQRGALRGKGTNPHLLVMTATPIPRTMALTMYADLDLSIIDEMPPGRTPIRTRIIGKNDRVQVYHELIEEELNKGRQAFIVYSLVEPSDGIEAESAVEGLEKMQQVFYKYKVGLLHGKMKSTEKDEIMAAFRDRAFDVLVTTSVAEVGVDIPNATVMLIEDANRFGLSQLHQFRGRVGRGAYTSYCLLVCETPVEEAKERLLAMERYTDGFKLAEIDWKLRGAGDLIGTRQSGSGIEGLMGEMTPDLVELAQYEARAINAEDPNLTLTEHQILAKRVSLLRDERSDVS